MVPVRQAIILAGGQATRMRPYTDDSPKAMIPVANVPIVGYQLHWLASHGIHHVIISCGYKSQMIRDYVGDGNAFGVSVSYADEESPLGRGGGLKYSMRWLDPHETFLALNGDIIAQVSIDEIVARHRSSHAVATLALARYTSNWGIVEVGADGAVTDFVQSPVLPYWINAGVYVCEPELADLLPDQGDHENSTFPELAQHGQLMSYPIEGYWRGIDTVKDVQVASSEIIERGDVLPSRFRAENV